ncbi:MAG: hypothetical protein IKE66_07285 [Hyphomicrobium sp.]|nr:hypothetical protein [Hyphomicrobium sp.]
MANAKMLCGASILACVAVSAPAAAIECRGGYQVVQGNLLSTPYCQDALLAQVARQYGFRTSAAAIRQNPNHKREICRFVGRDIRVQENCITANPNGRGRAF